MIFRLFIICMVILAAIYYLGIILQCLLPRVFHITDLEIRFSKAAIPFYYWIKGKKKNTTNESNQLKTTTQWKTIL